MNKVWLVFKEHGASPTLIRFLRTFVLLGALIRQHVMWMFYCCMLKTLLQYSPVKERASHKQCTVWLFFYSRLLQENRWGTFHSKDVCFDNADQLRFSKAECTNVDQQKTLQQLLLYLKHWVHLDRLHEDSDTAELDMWKIPHMYTKKAAQENDVIRFAFLVQSSYLHAL